MWDQRAAGAAFRARRVPRGRRKEAAIYFDTKPCQVCGSEVELRPHEARDDRGDHAPVGPSDGVVGDADSTVDVRVCTNPDCASHAADGPEP
jgi:hypothetical protein